MTSRFRFTPLWLALLCTGMLASAGETKKAKDKERPSPQALLKIVTDKKASDKDRAAACKVLVEHKDAAVGPIMQAYMAGGLHEAQVRSLIQTLGRIGTPSAAQSLQRIVKMGPPMSEWAMAALAGIQLPEVHNFILKYEPKNDDERQIQVRALEHVPGEAATKILVQALDHKNAKVSTRARQVLLHRIAKREVPGDYFKDLVERMSERDADELPSHCLPNALQVAAALPGEEGIETLAECLESDRVHVSRPAIGVLARKPRLVANDLIREALQAALEIDPDKKDVIAILRILQKAKEKKALSLVVKCLDHKDRQVYAVACDTMAILTKKNLGRNPAKWKAWYEENR